MGIKVRNSIEVEKNEDSERFEQFKEYSYFHLPGCWNRLELEIWVKRTRGVKKWAFQFYYTLAQAL